jgi:hypothetical protein
MPLRLLWRSLLKQGRWPSFARIVACSAGCVTLTLGPARAQSVSIQHDGVRCVLADRFPVLEASFEPADAVARARVLFRAAGSGDWYYVEMKQDQDVFRGILPKPLKTTPRIEYYIDALDRSLGQARTQDYSAAVVQPGQCAPSLRIAAATSSAKVPLGSLSPGAPLPPGFSAAGIVSFAAGGTATAGGATGNAVAGAATSGGGLSTTTLVAVVGAAAVAGGVALASSSDDSSKTANLAGHWAGTYTFQTNILCDVEMDLTADLTQSGTSLAGPGTFRTRTSARPDCGRQDLQITWHGSLAGNEVTLTFVHAECTSSMTGSVSGSTMAGTWRESGSGGCEGQTGIWTLARQ